MTRLAPIALALLVLLAGCASNRAEVRQDEPSYKDMVPAVADRLAQELQGHDFGQVQGKLTARVILPVTIEQRSSERFDQTLYAQAMRNALDASGKVTYTEETTTPYALFGRVSVITRPGEASKTTNFTVELRRDNQKVEVVASQDFPWKTE
jgi:hypothetical protein